MSVKSGRGLATSKPDLDTLVEEGGEAGDDPAHHHHSFLDRAPLLNRRTVEAEVEPEPDEPASSSQRRMRHALSEENGLYECAGSQLSAESVHEPSRRRPSSSGGHLLLHSGSLQKPASICGTVISSCSVAHHRHRKSASVSIEGQPLVEPPRTPLPNLDLIMAQASARAESTGSRAQRRFSLMSLLNNVTAPMRRSKTAQVPAKRKESGGAKRRKRPSPKRKDKITGRVASSTSNPGPSTAIDRPLSQPAMGPCTSFDVCQVADNSSDVYRPAPSITTPTHSPQPSAHIQQCVASSETTVLKVRNYLDHMKSAKLSDRDDLVECQLCYDYQHPEQFTQFINCTHGPCNTCVLKYLEMEIMESRVIVTCPECVTPLHPNDIYRALQDNGALLARYEKFVIRRVLVTEPDVRWCPAPDCDYAVIASGCAACPQLECQRPGCGTLFCYHCKAEWHANQTCDEARGQSVERMFASATAALAHQAFPSATSTSALNNGASSPNDPTNDLFKPGDLKACPRCGTLIVKMNDGSCNHMVCPMCQADFCWLCLKEISDLHYLSPTGCTFWGKKPWTRKKKLLWQMGTLIGAPVGIALIAGLAVPGIICGVPVFVGRKAYQRFKELSKGKRRLVTAASVAGSLVVSPVLAVMAVGVGVPIMLAYVYGVVPLSLCRNGGCGGGASTNTDEDGRPLGLLDLAEDAELGRAFLHNLRSAAGADERSRLVQRRQRDSAGADRMDATSLLTTNSTFSSNNFSAANAPGPSSAVMNNINNPCSSASVAQPHHSRYGTTNAPLPPDSMSQQSCLSTTALSSNLNVQLGEQRRRKVSVDSCANSIGERLNYESASTKANAGSHYHFDNKSVNTVCSGPEVQSYNEESASVLAMSGSIDGKSLVDTGSLRHNRTHRLSSRPERDLSPSEVS